MHTIGLKELRINTKKYVDIIRKGGHVVVMRRTRPLFIMIPCYDEKTEWKIVTDFTKIKRGGILLEDVLQEYAEKSDEPTKI